MESQQLLIPEKIKVGYQKRDGTYTGKLAYIIYFDHAGKLRKETSWSNWRDKGIEPHEFQNEPKEGFVLNKGVGGARQSYGWNARNEYIRVYDPRGFEFEISVANLLFILRECDCNKGKGLEGKFVYAWDGTSLVLLPVTSLDYQNSKEFTALQSASVKAKELVPGFTYVTKQQNEWTYLGRFNYYYMVQFYGGKIERKGDEKGVERRHIFWDGTSVIAMKDVKNIAAQKSDVPHPDFAELVDKYNNSANGSKVVELFLKNEPSGSCSWYYKDDNGRFVKNREANLGYIDNCDEYYLNSEGVFIYNYNYHLSCFYDNSTYQYENNLKTKSNTLQLFAKMANGNEIKVDYNFNKE